MAAECPWCHKCMVAGGETCPNCGTSVPKGCKRSPRTMVNKYIFRNAKDDSTSHNVTYHGTRGPTS